MIKEYQIEAQQRQQLNLPPLPLSPDQTLQVTVLLETDEGEKSFLLDLLCNRVEPGVSKSAKIKADWLEEVALGRKVVKALTPIQAVGILGHMGGGYNIEVLIGLLEDEDVALDSAKALKGLIKVYDGFDAIATLAKYNSHAKDVIESWARAEWFVHSPKNDKPIKLKLYKVDGEINTDDFSPGNQAQSRADIPLHATFFGNKRFPDGIETIARYTDDHNRVALAGDVVGTGSSRKSAVNSLLWHTGEDIPHVPNKRIGGVVFGGTLAPIFYATARDAGILPVECDVDKLSTGDVVTLDVQSWILKDFCNDIIPMQPAPTTLLDEYRAGGRLNLIIGKQLTRTACEFLDLPFPEVFQEINNPQPESGQKYTLAQKMVGKACGMNGVLPGAICEPKMTTVGSQDTTGPMTMQEIEELACLRFKAGLFMQSFCHTAAYPKKSDLTRWETMMDTTVNCNGVALKPGDGVIHPWINKMLVPDSVGTGGDSHTRFPLGISFPAGSGLVAFGAALGFMPLEMPASVLVRFTGERKRGITVRDMVNAIPYFAMKRGLLSIDKKGKKNIFAGAILEIEGVDDLSVEEAFELTDASAERSAAACTVKLPLETVVENVNQNVSLLTTLVQDGYSDRQCLEDRIAELKNWLERPELLEADDNAEYKEIIEINLSDITEPILACPNDPDDVRLLSDVAGKKIDEAFIGSCMTHLTHLQSASHLLTGEAYAKARLWVAPSTRMDRDKLQQDGGFSIFAQVGGRVEIPGCSLCMGNQARVKPGTTVISTSTRNFDNRLGDETKVYLGSTELTALTSIKGVLPTAQEYFDFLLEKEW